jgi:transcriptional regulator with XRE-family HTH domain
MFAFEIKIRELITENRLTIRKFCERIGMTNPNLYVIFKRNSIDSKYLERISNEFGVPVSYFYDDEYKKKLEESGMSKILENEKIDALSKKIHELEEKNRILTELNEANTEIIRYLKQDVNMKEKQITGNLEELIYTLWGTFIKDKIEDDPDLPEKFQNIPIKELPKKYQKIAGDKFGNDVVNAFISVLKLDFINEQFEKGLIKDEGLVGLWKELKEEGKL